MRWHAESGNYWEHDSGYGAHAWVWLSLGMECVTLLDLILYFTMQTRSWVDGWISCTRELPYNAVTGNLNVSLPLVVILYNGGMVIFSLVACDASAQCLMRRTQM